MEGMQQVKFVAGGEVISDVDGWSCCGGRLPAARIPPEGEAAAFSAGQ